MTPCRVRTCPALAGGAGPLCAGHAHALAFVVVDPWPVSPRAPLLERAFARRALCPRCAVAQVRAGMAMHLEEYCPAAEERCGRCGDLLLPRPAPAGDGAPPESLLPW